MMHRQTMGNDLHVRSVVVCLLIVAMCVVCLAAADADAERIKDIATFEGFRENMLIGYGLVVGLNGVGDKGDATLQSIANMLQRLGTTVRFKDIKAKNAAAVMVTAKLPPFPKAGTKVDALVSTIGDAKSLQGGTLLLTPLKGPDNAVYALAQGAVSVGGFVAGGGGTTVTKNHPTAGRVPEGVIIEKEPQFTLGDGGEIRVFLNRSDFTTARKIADAINKALASDYAVSHDPSAVSVKIPSQYEQKLPELVSIIEGLEVNVDVPARIVVNEKTGTVVIGDKVRISPVAIAHGSLTIDIKTEYQVSQPGAFAPQNARTAVVPDTDVKAKEQKSSLMEVSGVTLGEIVRGLNALGVTPRDLISILQALKSAGALRADLEII